MEEQLPQWALDLVPCLDSVVELRDQLRGQEVLGRQVDGAGFSFDGRVFLCAGAGWYLYLDDLSAGWVYEVEYDEDLPYRQDARERVRQRRRRDELMQVRRERGYRGGWVYYRLLEEFGQHAAVHLLAELARGRESHYLVRHPYVEEVAD